VPHGCAWWGGGVHHHHGMHLVVAITAALLAALCFASASVLQHRSAQAAPQLSGMHLGQLARFVVDMVRSPLWLLGTTGDLVGLVLQAVALARASLALVQPLLVCGLLFSIGVDAALTRRAPTRRQLGAAVVTVLGLLLFTLLATPHGGGRLHGRPAAAALLVTGAGVAALAVLGARRPHGPTRAGLLGAACGLVFGATAAVLKQATEDLGHGVGTLLGGWPFYVMLLLGVVTIVLAQSAFAAGPLTASLPGIAVADPLVAVALGAVMFREQLGRGAADRAGLLVGLIVMSVGAVVLARANARVEETVLLV